MSIQLQNAKFNTAAVEFRIEMTYTGFMFPRLG